MANFDTLKSEFTKAVASIMLVAGGYCALDAGTDHFQPLSQKFKIEKTIKATQEKAIAKEELTARDKAILSYASHRKAEAALGIALMLGSLAIATPKQKH